MEVAILAGCLAGPALGTKDCARFNCPRALSQLRFLQTRILWARSMALPPSLLCVLKMKVEKLK